mmetsp:Transcript_8892/g.19546  ORF Transcript_8892/g.19546 Transcript_8892/m.19546 type:complete len:639 (-) Transcript_8892:71-1987(-)
MQLAQWRGRPLAPLAAALSVLLALYWRWRSRRDARRRWQAAVAPAATSRSLSRPALPPPKVPASSASDSLDSNTPSGEAPETSREPSEQLRKDLLEEVREEPEELEDAPDEKLEGLVDEILALREKRFVRLERLELAGEISVYSPAGQLRCLPQAGGAGHSVREPLSASQAHGVLIYCLVCLALAVSGALGMPQRAALYLGCAAAAASPVLLLLVPWPLEWSLVEMLGKPQSYSGVELLGPGSGDAKAAVCRASAALPSAKSEAVWRAARAWASDSPKERRRALRRCKELAVLIETKASADELWGWASAAVLAPEGGDKSGLAVETFSPCRGGTQPSKEALDSAAASATGLLQRLLKPPASTAATRTLTSVSASPAEVQEVSAIAERVFGDVARLAVEEGQPWVSEGELDGVSLSHRAVVGHKAGAYRGVVHVPGTRGLDPKALLATISAHSSRCIYDNLYYTSVVLQDYGDQRCLLWMGMRKTAFTSQSSSVVIAASRHVDDGFSLVLAQAPPHLVERHSEAVSRLEAHGKPQRKDLPLWAWDVRRDAEGGFRVAFIFIPELRGIPVPFFLLRKALVAAPSIVDKVVKLAFEGMLPRTVALAGPEPEETEVRELCGQDRAVSKILLPMFFGASDLAN